MLGVVIITTLFMAMEGCSSAKKEDASKKDAGSEGAASVATESVAAQPVAPAVKPVVKKSPTPTKTPAVTTDEAKVETVPEVPQSLTATAVESLPKPVIMVPAEALIANNNSVIDIIGACAGAFVEISGDINVLEMVVPAGKFEQPCVDGQFSFKIQKLLNGYYNLDFTTYNLSRTGQSLAAQLSWIVDFVPPTALTINQPTSNPYVSTDNTLDITGNCEPAAVVAISGPTTGTTTCSSQGSFSFNLNPQNDGTYAYTLVQSDKAGNHSPQLSFEWTRKATIPPPPTITAPSDRNYRSAGPTLTIQGACTDGFVALSGNIKVTDVVIPAGSLETACKDKTFSFTVTKTASATYEIKVIAKALSNAPASAPAIIYWHLDSSAPADPIITKPLTNPHFSSDADLEIHGSCEAEGTVTLGGAASQQTVCSADQKFSFLVQGLADDIHNFTIMQTDAVGNVSGGALLSWHRNTALPSQIQLAAPDQSPVYTSTGSLILAGDCTNEMQVVLSGDVAATDISQPAGMSSLVCVNSSFSFVVNKTQDKTYNLQLTQVDKAYNLVSPVTAVSWIKDSAAPAAPVISSPASAVFNSGDDAIILAGSCENGAIVTISDAMNGQVVCSDSVFSFDFEAQTDGVYSFALTQTDRAGNISSATSVTWTRDTAIPWAPTIDLPATSQLYSKDPALTLSGSCNDGYEVTLSGDVTAAEVDSLSKICNDSSYSYQINKQQDGSYAFQVVQKSPWNNKVSAPVAVNWLLDRMAPVAPSIMNPMANPYISGDDVLTLEGECEVGAQLLLTGSETQSANCLSGTFNFALSQSVDSSYNYYLTQKDRAGNTSSVTTFTWSRDTAIPSTPLITLPSSDPFIANVSNLVLTGACTPGHVVHLRGHVVAAEVLAPSSSLSQKCPASAVYSFSIVKTVDGAYTFVVEQQKVYSDESSISSAQDDLTWIRDTIAPAAVTRNQPVVSPYTSAENLLIIGSCEPHAVVSLSGSLAQSAVCDSNGHYSLTATAAEDGIYNYTILQTDRAGNSSNAIAGQWIKDSGIPSTPLITLPAASPYVSSSSSLTLAGSCDPGLNIFLAGVQAGEVVTPSGALSQYCGSNGAFSFTVEKAGDGTYDFDVYASNGTSNSGNARITWVRDTTPPVVTLSAAPPQMNVSVDASFSFTAGEAGVNFECSLDGAAFASCSAPLYHLNMVNGSHTERIRAIDSVGNVSNEVVYNWTQSAYNTVALYHFNTDTGLHDASGYGNTLADSGTMSSAAGKFGAARSIASGKYLSAAASSSLGLLKKTATFEAWVKFSTLPGKNSFVNILSRNGSSSGTYGWELLVGSSKGKNNFLTAQFRASTDGTMPPESVSAASQTPLETGVWYHIAATFDNGTVRIFINGIVVATGTIGVAGSSSLFSPDVPLYVGSNNEGGSNLPGLIDEVRLSQIVRWPDSFSLPAAEYAAD
jgi:hypothetical protein